MRTVLHMRLNLGPIQGQSVFWREVPSRSADDPQFLRGYLQALSSSTARWSAALYFDHLFKFEAKLEKLTREREGRRKKLFPVRYGGSEGWLSAAFEKAQNYIL